MLIGLGIGMVGPMNRKSGTLLHPQDFPNPAWDDEVPLKNLMQEATKLPCEIDNGANTAVLAEYLFGVGREHQSVAYIHCGVGIRSAVIRDGMIIRTMNDSEDAFAHMTIDINGTSCKCGSKGCLENYVSLEAIRLQFCSITGKDIGYKGLFSRATGGDATAVDAFKSSARILGVGISNLSKLLNPDLIILSGPLVSNHEPYYSVCINSFLELNSKNSAPAFSKEGTFKEEVVAIGAGLMIMEQYLIRK
jgi:predicted NBD/HSP70 family sugar kinase